MTVLVAYASRHGATEEIAARIAARIADGGTAVDLRHVDRAESLDGYDAVVFGAPVYDQSWPPEADAFVNRHRDALAARAVWLFSVGSFGDTKRLIGPLTHKEPKMVEPSTRVRLLTLTRVRDTPVMKDCCDTGASRAGARHVAPARPGTC